MRIVMCATTFPPKMGGLENVAEVTAEALARGGDDVTVLTLEPGPPMPDRAYRLIRQPTLRTARAVLAGADVALLLNVGMKMLPAIVLARTPLAIWHHGELPRGARLSLADATLAIKYAVAATLCRVNIACSDFVRASLPARRPRVTLPNPYDPAVMFEDKTVTRDRDLIFVGRLVSDKGVAILLDALALPGGPLADARLSIVGDGPERPMLEAQSARSGLAGRVSFLGPVGGADLRRVINAHRVLVVPSIWEEPFGIVVLEGLACGCAVVAAQAGGLPEALGGFGRTYPKRDVAAAAHAIAHARTAAVQGQGAGVSAALADHLGRHAPANVGAALHAILQKHFA